MMRIERNGRGLLLCCPLTATPRKFLACGGSQMCGGFCKASKAANHCKFCKCKTCSFCGGKPVAAALPVAATPTAAPAAASAADAASRASAAPVDAAPAATLRPYAPGSGAKPTVRVPSALADVGDDPSRQRVGLLIALWTVLVVIVGGAGAFAIDVVCRSRGGFVSTGGSGERSAFLRGHARFDDNDVDDASQLGLEDDFRAVELLEESLKLKANN